jgi:hypothetical protein
LSDCLQTQTPHYTPLQCTSKISAFSSPFRWAGVLVPARFFAFSTPNIHRLAADITLIPLAGQMSTAIDNITPYLRGKSIEFPLRPTSPTLGFGRKKRPLA